MKEILNNKEFLDYVEWCGGDVDRLRREEQYLHFWILAYGSSRPGRGCIFEMY